MELFETLDDFFDKTWDLFFQAAHKRNDPMRTPMMSTYANGRGYLRTIVLRDINRTAATLTFFTDMRSAKVKEIKENPSLNVCFYHSRKNIQMRTFGSAIVMNQNDHCKEYWDKLSVRGRKTYATILPPGTETEVYTTGLPENWSDDLEKEDTDYVFQHFALIVLRVEEIDCLHLHPEGHQRAYFKQESQEWKKHWLIP